MRLIDADALIMALRLEYPMIPMFKENQEEWGIKTEGYRKAEEVIKDAPTIEPKQGKWIDAEIRHEDGVLPIQVCSECKTFYPLEYTGGGHRFCPNCGAEMREREGE